MLFYFIFFIIFLYFLFNLSLIIIWCKNKPFSAKKNSTITHSLPFITVIIPVRNEEKNIGFLLKDLQKQTLNKTAFEVIIADDSSTDATLAIVREFQKKATYRLIINQLADLKSNSSPKKRAIESSIKRANGTLITTTDGDCRVGEQWLETISLFYEEKKPYLISAPVSFLSTKNSFFENYQIIEFASLVGSGGCAMMAGKPNMCNGANLTYEKKIFYEVDGFAGNEQLASGDDEFLMHKIANRFPEKVQFLKSKEAIVYTYAHESWKSFYHQRKRWASKWKHYQNWQISALAVFIFSANFCWLLVFGFWFLAKFSVSQLIILSSLKFSAEFLILALFVKFFNKNPLSALRSPPYLSIPIVQIIYPFYVVFFGLISQGKKEYEWKGRRLQ